MLTQRRLQRRKTLRLSEKEIATAAPGQTDSVANLKAEQADIGPL